MPRNMAAKIIAKDRRENKEKRAMTFKKDGDRIVNEKDSMNNLRQISLSGKGHFKMVLFDEKTGTTAAPNSDDGDE